MSAADSTPEHTPERTPLPPAGIAGESIWRGPDRPASPDQAPSRAADSAGGGSAGGGQRRDGAGPRLLGVAGGRRAELPSGAGPDGNASPRGGAFGGRTPDPVRGVLAGPERGLRERAALSGSSGYAQGEDGQRLSGEAAPPVGDGPGRSPHVGPGGPSRGGGGAGVNPGVRRRGPADPVRSVMHGHREMIAGAVDVWEIAAGLEARGVTDADARRLRHRDVFGLAEEVYARVPRAVRVADRGSGNRERPWPSAATGGLNLLPGLVCTLTAAVHLAAPGALLAVAAGWAILRRTARGAGAVWAGALLGFALCGPQAVAALAGHGSFNAFHLGRGGATFAALTLSLVPAAYATQWFAVRARAQLAPSHGLAEFADAVRPRLAAALAGYGLALFLLLTAATGVGGPAPIAGPATLGLLLFTARLLAVHGRPRLAAAGLAAACAAEALVLAAAPLRLGLGGATAEALICGAAALALAVHAFRVLPRASAHRGPTRL
jgi:hypothetical protein